VPHRLSLYCDSPTWAQCHFVRDLARQSEKWGWASEVMGGFLVPSGLDLFYSPCCGTADGVEAHRSSTGLWSHVSYGGWFSDTPLNDPLLPKAPYHATNLYLYELLDRRVPYLASGVDTDVFQPATGRKKGEDRRLVVGWTGSLQYNAAVKLFLDLLIPAVRRAGSDGKLSESRICFRPLVVWDCRDARTPLDVAEYLKDVDVYVCTSASEGCSLSVLEAAAAGCVIVSTPCGNAPELTKPEFLVPWSVEGISDVLLRLYEDRRLLQDTSAWSRQLIMDRWSWDAPKKKESWQAWLSGEGSVQSPEEQLGTKLGVVLNNPLLRSRKGFLKPFDMQRS
jgi:glycosyltransferase involved in cell wall biosynthesis